MRSEKIGTFKAGTIGSGTFENLKVDADSYQVSVYIFSTKSSSTMIICDRADVLFNSYENTDSDYEVNCFDAKNKLIAIASSDFIRGRKSE